MTRFYWKIGHNYYNIGSRLFYICIKELKSYGYSFRYSFRHKGCVDLYCHNRIMGFKIDSEYECRF